MRSGVTHTDSFGYVWCSLMHICADICVSWRCAGIKMSYRVLEKEEREHSAARDPVGPRRGRESLPPSRLCARGANRAVRVAIHKLVN